jgi:hypothetical protein
MFSSSRAALAGIVRVQVSADGTLDKTIWLSPTTDKTLVLPGYITFCQPPTTQLIVISPFAPTDLGEKGEQWTQKLSVGLNLGSVTERNAPLIQASLFKVTCQVQVNEKKEVEITFPMRVDVSNRFVDQDKYVIGIDDERVINLALETKVSKGARLEFGRPYVFPKKSETAQPEQKSAEEPPVLLKNARPYYFPKKGE